MGERDRDASYLVKARESLAGAESEYANGRYNNCTNRAHYACFQAAIAALLRAGIRASDDRWAHTFVQSQFVGVLVNRRHRYPAVSRGTLANLQILRHDADYRPETMHREDARQSLRSASAFVDAIWQGEGNR